MNALQPTINMFDPHWVTRYSEIKNQFRTGDIILVHGKYPFSWLIEVLQGSNWGHCAMIVLAKDLDPAGKHNFPEVMIWESNVLIEGAAKNLWGSNQGYKEGPMLISLEERLNHTQANFKNVQIAYRPIYPQLQLPTHLLPDFFDKVIDHKFPSDREIISSIFLGRTQNRVAFHAEEIVNLDINFDNGTMRFINFRNNHFLNELSKVDINKDELYCSELVAMTYKTLGLLTQNHVSNAYAPKDFSKEGSTRLLGRSWLGAEMFFDMTL